MKRLLSIILALAIFLALAMQGAANTAGSIKNVDGIMYLVSSDGSLGNKYNGWTKGRNTGNRFYYIDGERVTGVHVMKDSRYVFDDKGVFLLNRTTARESYSVIFPDDYNVNINDDKAAFDVKIKNKQDIDRFYDGKWLFSLFIYTDGRWQQIPYIDADFDLEPMEVGDDGNIRFYLYFDNFEFKFEAGLYRVSVELFFMGTGHYQDDLTTVIGEFNIT